jgi:hypothetical protein
MESKFVVGVAKGAGISKPTLDRAKASLGVISYKEGGKFGGEGAKWYWKLPPQDYQEAPQGYQPDTVDNLVVNDSDKTSYSNGLAQDYQDPKSDNLVDEVDNLVDGDVGHPTRDDHGVQLQNGTPDPDNLPEARRLISSLYQSGKLRQADLGLVEKIRDQLRDPGVTSISESRMKALQEMARMRGVIGH